MAIIERVNEAAFIDAFRSAGRAEQFTYDALCELFAYYDQLSEGIGEDVELDVIGICCEWTEYCDGELLDEFREYAAEEDPEDRIDEILDALRDRTTVIDVGHGVYLIREF